MTGKYLIALWTGLLVLAYLAVLLRVILRKHREPASRVAWIGGNRACLLPDNNGLKLIEALKRLTWVAAFGSLTT